MKRKLPPYLMRVERQARRRRIRRRQVASTVVVILVLAAVVALAFRLPGSRSTAGSTTTSLSTTQVASSAVTTGRPVVTTTTTGARANGEAVYSAALTGRSEIPAVTTPASGNLKLNVAAGGLSVGYVLTVSNITDCTVARLHEGKAGAGGPKIITLYGGPGRSGAFSGVLAQGTFAAADLQGPLQGRTVADLVALIKSGRVYLNVGTSKHIAGEIRGQLE